MDTKTIDTSIDEFDEEAFDEALEAYWSADGGTYGGVRAAIRKYNDLVAGRQALAEADARDDARKEIA